MIIVSLQGGIKSIKSHYLLEWTNLHNAKHAPNAYSIALSKSELFQFWCMFQYCLLLQKEGATPAIAENASNEIREQPPDEISLPDKMNDIICIYLHWDALNA